MLERISSWVKEATCCLLVPPTKGRALPGKYASTQPLYTTRMWVEAVGCNKEFLPMLLWLSTSVNCRETVQLKTTYLGKNHLNLCCTLQWLRTNQIHHSSHQVLEFAINNGISAHLPMYYTISNWIHPSRSRSSWWRELTPTYLKSWHHWQGKEKGQCPFRYFS